VIVLNRLAKKMNRYLLTILAVLLCFTLMPCGSASEPLTGVPLDEGKTGLPLEMRVEAPQELNTDETKTPIESSAQESQNYTSTSIKDDGEDGKVEKVAIGIDNSSDTTTSSSIIETEKPTESTHAQPVVPLGHSTFSVRFINVGQGDAALVECDGHYMLIDGGTKRDSSRMYAILKNEGVTKLDIIVGTHAHEDHIGGLPGALNYATADLILCPVTSYDSKAFNDFVKYANLNGNGIVIPPIGAKYSLGSATVTILGLNASNDANNSSIVLKVQYGATSFLFTGDAEREAEQAILNSGFDLSATVLKVGHHGGDTSTTYPFLREIMPQYAVISVGKDNSYGHPMDNTLSRLRDANVTVFRTDLNGDIVFTSDGKSVSVSVAKQAS
jgi:competence protein ComEC